MSQPSPESLGGGGNEAVEHQTFVGTGYFDELAELISGGESAMLAMNGSTEREQFQEPVDPAKESAKIR